MQRGLKVANGDRLGRPSSSLRTVTTPQYIVERFDHHYPHLKGHFARAIDYKVTYAQSLIDDFSQPEKDPHIAVSVDMLDTGIDIPEIVNLAFFKNCAVKDEVLADDWPGDATATGPIWAGAK